MNYKMIRNVLGYILIFEALFLLIPVITAIVYGEKEIWDFLITMGVCLAIGGLMIIKKPENKQIFSREGFVIVALSWILLSVFGAIPFYISGAIPSVVDAIFETVSGFTTTGATILNEVESLPNSILIWRSFIHWVGGMGVLVFIMAFVPLSGGANNMRLMKAESTGPSVSKLVPRVKTTALILYSIYFVFTLAQFIFLLFGGISVFEAMNIAFSTAGTGGFGVKNDSLAGYSTYIHIVTGVFMLLFSLNFGIYYALLKGKFKEAFNAETRTFLGIVLVVTVLIISNSLKCFDSIGEAIHQVFFTVSSIVSSTGYITVDYDLWPQFSQGLLIFLMIMGGCAGSTAGGVKVYRIIVWFKAGLKEISFFLHPKQSKKVTVDNKPVDHEVVRSVNIYLTFYIAILIISVLIVSIDNLNLFSSFTAVLTTLNNIGPGFDLSGPTESFSIFSVRSKIVFIFDMLAGRLELFPIIVLFYPSTWKK